MKQKLDLNNTVLHNTSSNKGISKPLFRITYSITQNYFTIYKYISTESYYEGLKGGATMSLTWYVLNLTMSLTWYVLNLTMSLTWYVLNNDIT